MLARGPTGVGPEGRGRGGGEGVASVAWRGVVATSPARLPLRTVLGL